MTKRFKKLGVREYQERDKDILAMYQMREMTMEKIGKLYGISTGRVYQIISRERQRNSLKAIPLMLQESLCERLETLYGYLIPETMRTGISIRAVFMHTLRYLKNREFVNHQNRKTWPEWVLKCPTDAYLSPKTWVEWLKQATDGEIYGIRSIGVKKARILIKIRNDILKRRTERERDLVCGVERLY